LIVEINRDREKRITYKDAVEFRKIERMFVGKGGLNDDRTARIIRGLAKRVDRQIAELKDLISKRLEEDAAKERIRQTTK